MVIEESSKKMKDELGAAERLGRAIQMRRAELGLKRPDLAKLAKLSYPYVSEIEKGQKQPSANALRQLADALGLTESELYALADRIQQETATSRHLQSQPRRSPPMPMAYATEQEDPPVAASPGLADAVFERWIQEAVSRYVQAEFARWSANELPKIVRREVGDALRNAQGS